MISAAEFLKWLEVYNIKPGGGGSGTVTSITAGAGLNGGTITTTGTISLKVLTVSPVLVAAEFNLNATYANGASGVGATLTNAGTLAALIIDGVTLQVGDRLVVVGQSTTFQNGVYQVSNAGSGAVAWVITRTTDFDAVGEMPAGINVSVSGGDNLAGSIYVLTSPAPVTIGTNPIIFISMLETANAIIDAYLPLSGGVLTGPLTLSADATLPLEAVTYQQLTAVAGITPAQVQNEDFNFGTDTGIVDAYVVDLTPVPTIGDGFRVSFIPDNTNTITNPTVNVNGNGDQFIFTLNGSPVVPGDLSNVARVDLEWSVTFNAWLLQNPYISSRTYYIAPQETGAADAYVVSLPDSVLGYTDNLTIVFNPANSCTGPSTLDANFGPFPIVKQNTTPLALGDIVANINAVVIFNAVSNTFQLTNPQTATGGGGVTPAEIQNQTYVYSSAVSNIGNDYSVTMNPPLASLQAGQKISFLCNQTNTNSQQGQFARLNVDGLGDVLMVVYALNAVIPMWAGGIVIGQEYDAEYDGIFWVIQNPSSSVNGLDLVANLWGFGADTIMTPNSYGITVPVVPLDSFGNIIAGTTFVFRAGSTNTSSSTITLTDGIGNVTGPWGIDLPLPSAGWVGGEIQTGGLYQLMSASGGGFRLMNPATTGATPAQVQNQAFSSATDTGIADAYVVTLSPAWGGADNTLVLFRPANNNTTASTLDVGSGPKPLIKQQQVALAANDIVAGTNAVCIYSQTNDNFELINPQGIAPGTGSINFLVKSDGDQNFNSGAAAVITGMDFIPDANSTYLLQAYVSITPQDSSSQFTLGLTDGALVTSNITLVSGQADIFQDTGGTPLMTVARYANQSYGIEMVSPAFPAPTTTNTNLVLAEIVFTTNGTPGTCQLYATAGTASGTTVLNNTVCIYNKMESGMIGNVGVTPAQVQQSYFNAGNGVNSADTYSITLPGPGVFPSGSGIVMLPDSPNSTNLPLLAVNGGPGVNIFLPNGSLPFPGDLASGAPAQFLYFAGTPTLMNPFFLYTLPKDILQGRYTGYSDIGAANAYVANSNALQISANYNFATTIILLVSNTNNGASTLNFNGSGDIPIVYAGAPLTGGEMIAGLPSLLVGDGTNWNLLTNYAMGNTFSSVIPFGSAISVTTMTAVDITSVNLPAGKFKVWGNVSSAVTGLATGTAAWVSDTSATLPDFSLYAAVESNTAIASSGLAAPMQIFTFAVPTTVYLSTQSTFTTGAVTACGGLYVESIT